MACYVKRKISKEIDRMFFHAVVISHNQITKKAHAASPCLLEHEM